MEAKQMIDDECRHCGGESQTTSWSRGIDRGEFEIYMQCVDCLSEGTVIGTSAADSDNWEKEGRLFEG